MSCPGRTGATTRPAPVRVRSQNPSPEPKIRCLSPRLVDEDVVMFECEKEDPASVPLGVPHTILGPASYLLSVVAEPNAPVCPTATAPAEVDTHSDDDDDEEWEEEEEEEEDEEDGEIDHDLPSSAGATTGSLFNNRAKPPSPPPRAAPVEVQVPPLNLAPSGPTAVKVELEDESEDHDNGLWREPTRIPGSFLQHPDRLGSESATSGGHMESTPEKVGTSKGSSGSRGTEPGRAHWQPEPEGEHHEISINLASSAETANLELHLTSGSVAASKEHPPAHTSKPTFDLKVTAKGSGRVSISAGWRGLGPASALQTP